MVVLETAIRSTLTSAPKRDALQLEIPPDETLKDLLWRLTDGTSCTTCRHDVSAGFTSIMAEYIRYEQMENAAVVRQTTLAPEAATMCRQYRRALYAILRKNHGHCIQLS